MNMTHSSVRGNLTVRRYPNAAEERYFLNKAADAILCAASSVGIVAALFFLITM